MRVSRLSRNLKKGNVILIPPKAEEESDSKTRLFVRHWRTQSDKLTFYTAYLPLEPALQRVLHSVSARFSYLLKFSWLFDWKFIDSNSKAQMMDHLSRDDVLALLHEFTKSENLRKHALAVEASMRAYARKYGQDEEKWGVVGLIHDFDYEMYPDAPDHPSKGSEILRERGFPEDVRKAILGHADYMGVPRDTLMAKSLYACDELCGLITAVALVRPSKKLADVEVSSVKKKMRDKAFARSVSREDIERGVAELGVNLDGHIQVVLDAMKAIAPQLDL
jgi:putative nucleotidyltransferase with HDIG domain